MQQAAGNMSEDEKIQTLYRDICGQLNIDTATEEQSWKNFLEVQKTYNLSVFPLHWLCCSLYITCRSAVTPTVGNHQCVLQGNCVSMTKLLRLCKINLNDFFKKITQWVEMTSQPDQCCSSISNVRHNFLVSMSIYDKYCEKFVIIFLTPNEDEQRRGKKAKPQPCTPKRLFKFCWKLFLCAKAECPEQKGDLVTSYNMMLCCLDLMFANAIADGRSDLVNPTFKGLPKNFLTDGEIPANPICILDELNEEEDSGSVVKNIKETTYKNAIMELFGKRVLRGKADTFMELINVANFDENFKSLDSQYNTFILSGGEFDEGIVLEHITPGGAFQASYKSMLPMSVTGTPDRNSFLQKTPLNGRSRNLASDACKFTPISAANATVQMLRLKLLGYNGEPHASLRELFKMCDPDPTDIIIRRLTYLRGKFSNFMRDQMWNQRAVSDRFDMVEALYFRLLEQILQAEQRRCQARVVSDVCREDLVNQTLVVCCAEIVNYAHNLQQNFPSILNIFELKPFIFYRIIELVVRHHNDLLSGEIIKHLVIIENQCVESLAWKSDSPLWTVMANINYEVPRSRDVETSTDLSGITPHRAGDGVATNNHQSEQEPTPSTSTATPTGNSGPSNRRKIPNPESAKKRLFKMDDEEPKEAEKNAEGSERKRESPTASAVPRSNAALPMPLGFMSPLRIPVPNGSLSRARPGVTSLNLFFRKFYSMATQRMDRICSNLDLTSGDVREQIWSIFEYSIVNGSKELMRDRHLDQMLMCAIYFYARINRRPHTFTDVMKAYRTLPQSYSHVYRSVFISRVTTELQDQQQSSQYGNNGNTEGNDDTRRVQPNDVAGVSMQHGGEERGDIIKFYNTEYVRAMQTFAIQFGNEDERRLLMSPVPNRINRSVLLSPRQVDGRISLFITPMDSSSELLESPNARTYHFGRSPAKDLLEFNRVSSGQLSSCKRSLSDPDSYQQHPMKTNKLGRLISDRQQQESNGNPK